VFLQGALSLRPAIAIAVALVGSATARYLTTHRRELADRQQRTSRCQVGGDTIGVPGTFAREELLRFSA
jgi:hypothetical protein